MTAVYTMKGVGDMREVYEDKLTITPKGVLGFMVRGLTKAGYLESIYRQSLSGTGGKIR